MQEDYKIKQNQFNKELHQLLQQESVNIILDSINIFFSLVLIFVYIYWTYDHVPFENSTWDGFKLFIHCYLLSECILKIFNVKSMINYLISQESLVQLFTLLPYFIIKLSVSNQYAIQFSNLMSMLRVLELNRLKKYMDSEVNKQLLSIILSITTLIVTASATLHFNCQFLPPPNNELQFHYFIYFVMTTISTMGYENPFSSVVSRILIIILVAFAFAFVPAQSGELIRHLSSKSYYARRSYKASESIPHIVIMGTISTIAAENFFKELFHQDHGSQKKHAILLVPHRPDPMLESLIRLPQYEDNVIFIQGDPLMEKDLKRCQVEKAKAVILMCNKQSADANAEDSKTILLAMVIKKYLKQHGSTKTRFCMQLLRHEGKTHYYLSLNKQTKYDQVICIEELKMSLLAKSCLCPGLITVISNLITSSGDPPEPELLPYNWLHQYWAGQGFEIYKTQLPNFFRGLSFSNSVFIIYKKFEAVLFGIEIITDTNSRIFLNPGNMKLPTNRLTKIMGYIISQDKGVADDISGYKQDDENTNLQSLQSMRATVSIPMMNSSASIFNKVRSYFKSIPTLNAEEDDPERKALKSIRDSEQVQSKIQTKSYHATLTQKEKHDQIANKDLEQEGIIEDEDEEDEGNDSSEFHINHKFKDNFRTYMQSEYVKIDQKCHLTNEKVSLKDVSFKTLQDSILATNHVILCGMVSNLINFVLPLRAKYLSTYPPIVILNDHEPTEKQWNQICFFPDIYFIKGTALVQRDLLRANLLQASRIVILSPRVEEISKATFDDIDSVQDGHDQSETSKQQLTRDQEDLLDARTLFKYRNIVRLKPNIQIVTELVSPNNLSFLIFDKDYALMKKYGFNHTPIFASGQIYLSSVMDSLLCQAYYNPALMTVLYQLLVGNTNQPQVKDQYADIKVSNLFQMHVPTAFLNKPFEKLFNYMVKIKFIVPLALYRLQGSQDNKQPYIWTNPEQSTILTDRDLLLVLSQHIPPQDYLNWGGPLEIKVVINEKKQEKKEISITTTNDESERLLLNEDNEKELQRVKLFHSESEIVLKKIQSIIEEINSLRQQAQDLQVLLQNRQQRIIHQMNQVIKEELLNLLQQKQNDLTVQGKSSEINS